MTNKTIEFSYIVGSARFSTDTEVDVDEWDEMDGGERIDFLESVALEDVREYLEVEENSINDNE